MAPTPSELKAAAKQSIERTGLYFMKDQEKEDPKQSENATKGRQFARFYDAGYRTKTPEGLDFIINNTLKDPVIGEIIRFIIPQARWGYLRLYSDLLSSDYAWFFHIRDPKKEKEALHTLLVQFWMPGSSVVYYEGTQSMSFGTNDPENWGVMRTPASNMEREGISKREVDMPNGGCTIIDSRLGWTCRQGKFMNIGFGVEAEVSQWHEMELPDTKALRLKAAQLEISGIKTHFKFGGTQVSS